MISLGRALQYCKNFSILQIYLDVGFMMRKLGAAAKPNIRIADDGENIVIKTETTFTTHEIKFQPGVEFDETTSDGRKAKVHACMEKRILGNLTSINNNHHFEKTFF